MKYFYMTIHIFSIISFIIVLVKIAFPADRSLSIIKNSLAFNTKMKWLKILIYIGALYIFLLIIVRGMYSIFFIFEDFPNPLSEEYSMKESLFMIFLLLIIFSLFRIIYLINKSNREICNLRARPVLRYLFKKFSKKTREQKYKLLEEYKDRLKGCFNQTWQFSDEKTSDIRLRIFVYRMVIKYLTANNKHNIINDFHSNLDDFWDDLSEGHYDDLYDALFSFGDQMVNGGHIHIKSDEIILTHIQKKLMTEL